MGGGSPNTTTTTVDPVYNAGMLELSQEQQQWASEMYNMFKYGVTYNPEEVQHGTYIDGEWVSEDQLGNSPYSSDYYIENPDWQAWNAKKQKFLAQSGGIGGIGGTGQGTSMSYEQWLQQNPEPEQNVLNPDRLESTTLGELYGYDPEAQTSEMEYLQNLVEANQSLLGLQTDVSKGELESRMGQQAAERELGGLKTEVAKSFLADSMKGLDVGEQMDLAQANVQHGFKLADAAERKNLGQYGLDPGSGRFTSMNRERALAEAAGISGARTKASQDTERENFARKMAGTGLNIVGQGYYSDTGEGGSDETPKPKVRPSGGISTGPKEPTVFKPRDSGATVKAKPVSTGLNPNMDIYYR